LNAAPVSRRIARIHGAVKLTATDYGEIRMPLASSERNFGAVTKTFHWLTALLIFSTIPLGLIANDLAGQIRDPSIIVNNRDILRTVLLFSLHKTLGVTIFFVALARILWAISQPRPARLNARDRLESMLAETVHWLLYGSLVLVPLAGWVSHAATTGFSEIWWPFGQSLPFVPKSQAFADAVGGVHVVLQRVLYLAIALHIAGALKHHFLDRDATLRRMLPGTGNAPLPPGPARAGQLPLLAALLIWGGALMLGAAFNLYSSETYTSSRAGPERPGGQLAQSPPGRPGQPGQARANWVVRDGTLQFSITRFGATVAGGFSRWNAEINFQEPAEPGPAGAVRVTIDIGSLNLGVATPQAAGPDYFDTQTFPAATFTARILKTESGYVAAGPLTIRDKSVPVTLPFDLAMDGGTATMSGSLQVNRMDFEIGSSIPTEDIIGFAVDIRITLTAKRVAGGTRTGG
jgi:cytochrome b561/polyisoprenoid-binding protein YceI